MARAKTTKTNLQNNNVIRPALATLLILLIPLFGNQFIKGFNWGRADFIVMGAIVFGAGFVIELITKRVKNKNHRVMAVIAMIVILLWLWVELGVGLFTNWGS